MRQSLVTTVGCETSPHRPAGWRQDGAQNIRGSPAHIWGLAFLGEHICPASPAEVAQVPQDPHVIWNRD